MKAKMMLLGCVGLVALSADAHAQTNWMQWMNGLQQQSNASVRSLYYNCITHPGACKPAPGALDNANRQLQQAYSRQQANTQKNMNLNYQTINRWDDHAIKDYQYWTNPNTGAVYANNLSCRPGGR